MTYFYTCPDCGASTMVDTDDNDYAGKALAKFQRKHNCKGKSKKHEPIQQIQHSSQV